MNTSMPARPAVSSRRAGKTPMRTLLAACALALAERYLDLRRPARRCWHGTLRLEPRGVELLQAQP